MSYIPIKIRNFNPDIDFAAHTELLNAAAKTDGGEETTQDAQKQFVEMFGINLSTDRFVVENPQDSSQLIAICDCWQIGGNPSTDLFLLVHPDWRRKGIGTVLFQRAFSYSQSLKATAIDAYATPIQIGIQAFLAKHKFSVAGNFTEMHLTQETEFPKAILPTGYTVRTYNELDGNELDGNELDGNELDGNELDGNELDGNELDKINLILKAGNEFWGDLWGHKVGPDNDESRQAIREQILPEFPDDLMFFLFNENKDYIGHDSVKFSVSTENAQTKTGFVGVPALHRDYRTPELSKQFALVALNKLFEEGCREFSFSSWGESDATIQAFESLGFKTTSFEIGYQLELT